MEEFLLDVRAFEEFSDGGRQLFASSDGVEAAE